MKPLTIKLKQQTPIILFQNNQNGATLRGSDIKPRIDKYLNVKNLSNYFTKSCLDEDIIDAVNEQNERMNKKKGSLYQVEIQSQKPREFQVKKKGYRSLYFGDIDKMLFYKENVLIIKSFHPGMLKAAELAAKIMLANENFGVRQNKGYGSYIIDDCNIEDILTKSERGTVFYFDMKINDDNKKFHELFTKIYYMYNTLKGGVNEDLNRVAPMKYSKSLLFKYIKSKKSDLIWEKRLFKLELGNWRDFDSVKNHNNTILIRHLLGLSDTYNFTSDFSRNNKPARMDTEDYAPRAGYTITNDEISIKNNYRFILKNNNYARIPSPLLFKPVQTSNGFRVYIILKPDILQENSSLINPDFSVTKEKGIAKNKFIKVNKFNSTGAYILKSIDQFDLKDFFAFVKNKFDLQQERIKPEIINKYVSEIKIEKLV